MWAILQDNVDVIVIMKVRIEFADGGMFQSGLYFYFSLQLFVEDGCGDVLFGDEFDGYVFLAVFLDGSVDDAEFAGADLLADCEVVYCEGATEACRTAFAHFSSNYKLAFVFTRIKFYVWSGICLQEIILNSLGKFLGINHNFPF